MTTNRNNHSQTHDVQSDVSLQTEPREIKGRLVIRWSEAAKVLSVCPRSLRYAVSQSDIKPVRLPGRSRSIGLRASDVLLLAEGGLQ